jgi:hypothetical protein
MVHLRVTPKDDGQANFRQLLQNGLSPRRCTLGSRGIVSRPTRSRKAEPHGQNGDATRIVERIFTDVQFSVVASFNSWLGVP